MERKKNVAILINDSNWQGGNNYYNSLIISINKIKKSKINLFLISDTKSNLKYFNFNNKIIRSSIFDKNSFLYKLRLILNYLHIRDFILYLFLKKNNIDVLSHCTSRNILWRNCKIKTLGWIVDLQHIYFPKFFSKKNLFFRNNNISKLLANSHGIILSSKSCYKDLKRLYNIKNNKTFILSFCSSLINKNKFLTKQQLISKYKLVKIWFHLPNQFWKHKNQIIALKAFHLLKDKNKQLILTGFVEGLDQLEKFNELNCYIKKNNLENIKILKNIPYADVLAIMYYSAAMINTSYYEGWSSTVAEATALNKILILSKINTHIEQKTKKTFFFDPDNAVELKNIFYKIKISKNKKKLKKLIFENNKKLKKFGEKFQKIILDIS